MTDPLTTVQPDDADGDDLLTVHDLYLALGEAFHRGLDPNTAVVVGPPDHDWLQVRQAIGDPTARPVADEHQDWLWFTLFTGAPADPRFTPAHEGTTEQRLTAAYEEAKRASVEAGRALTVAWNALKAERDRLYGDTP
jgi:hypothetical protein